MSITLGVPQLIMCVLFTINLGLNIAKHGEDKNDKYNAWATLISIGINLWILKAGGFFG